MKAREVSARVYREDRSNEINWNNMVSREAGLHAQPTEPATNAAQVQNEYLRAQCQPNAYYGVEVQAEEADPSDAIVPVQKQVHFRVLGMAYGQHRAHVMPTVDDAEAPEKVAALAFEVVFQERRARGPEEDALPPGVVEVYDEGEPQWVRPTDIAPFTTLKASLMHYRKKEQGPNEACVLLSQPTLAVPQQALMAIDCPVLKLMDFLKQKGWEVAVRKCVHPTADVGKFDCEEALRARTYFQCLCILRTVLPLTTTFTSRQCIGYYRLLLRGLEATPDRPAKEYQLVLNKDLRKRGKKIEVPALEDDTVPIVGHGIIIAGPEMLPLPPPPKREAAPGPSRKRKATGDKGGGGDEPGREPVPLPPVCGPAGVPGESPPPAPPSPPATATGIIAGPAEPPTDTLPRRRIGRKWIPALNGAQIQYSEYKVPYTNSTYRNYIIKGPTPSGEIKSKTHGRVPQYTRRHGDIEPIAFLHCWLLKWNPAQVLRRRSDGDPSDEEVDAFVLDHRQELEDLFNELVGQQG